MRARASAPDSSRRSRAAGAVPLRGDGRRPAAVGVALARLAAALALALVAALPACRSTPRAPLGPVEPAFVPAFEALGQALEAGDDELAQRTLAGILARGPEGDTLLRAEAFGRVLEGRRLARALELQLVATPEGGDPSRLVVALQARHELAGELGLRSLPGMLELLVVGVDPNGLEQRSARSIGVESVAAFDVPPGRTERLRLGSFPVGTGTALAVRASFELVLPSGELLFEGRAYPANTLAVRPCSVQRLAPFLPTDPVEPEELVRYLGGQRVATPALLERAVRIAPERREEALEQLSAAALDMTRPELERALPALRWLSGQRHLGNDVDSWRRWLEQRRALAEAGRPVLPPRPGD